MKKKIFEKLFSLLLSSKLFNNQGITMKHPFQHILLDKTGEYFFAAAINTVFLFKIVKNDENDNDTNSDNIIENAKLLGSWTDEVDPYYTIRKHHRELLEQYEQQQREKEEKEKAENELSSNSTNENNKREIIPVEQIPTSTKQIMNKRPKLPLPGPGAPPTYTYIRDMTLSNNNEYLIITTDNDKAVVVFKINYNPSNDNNNEKVFNLTKRQPMMKRPSAICTTIDDLNILIADKFGDVYSLPLNDEKILNDNELKPILGHVSMLTGVYNTIDENNNQVIFTTDRDEHIRISYYPKSYIIKKILFGHKEFISTFILPKWCNNNILVSAGGDSFIYTWLWKSEIEGNEIKCKFNVDDLIKDKLNEKHLVPEKFQNDSKNLVEYCISKIIPLNKTNQLAIIFEKIPFLFIFDLSIDGELKFNREINVINDIITATCTNDLLILSFNNMDKCLNFYQIIDNDNIKPLENSLKLLETINNANDSVIGDIDELIPLFNTNYLRKRREH